MKDLKERFLYCSNYFLLWIGYFVFARLFFILFYIEKTKELDFITILKTFVFGLRLDASFVAYLSFIPFLLITLSLFISSKKIDKLLKGYSVVFLIISSLCLIVDANLYQSWGVRLDTSLFTYLNTPEVMIASATTAQIITGTILWSIISLVFIKIFYKVININGEKIKRVAWKESLILLLLTIVLIIPARGGWQTVPVNQSNVYFSNNMFANHAAINYAWNFFNALSHKTSTKNTYQYFDNKLAQTIIKKRRNQLLSTTNDRILNTTKPNVVLIVWESLTAKVVECLGGEPGVTENLNELSKEGILFTNFYANGDRTDKGIPAILSGYYPQPTKSIMKMPNKTRSLPMLPKEMINLGYDTSFYHGGDLNFGNMNTYLRNASITNFIDGNDFDKKEWNSKWGVHDHILMERLQKDLSKKQKEPFFKIALTLTSHEPFEFPWQYKFGKDTDVNKFRSSHAYTDKVIGNFINFAKKQVWYDNTLIIIIADHGHRFPVHEDPYNSPIKFKIPMLWLGGALSKKGIKVDHIASQVDLSYTILELLDGDNSDFVFSKNIFNASKKQYAHYIFNKGFGTLTKNGVYVYDYTSKTPLLEEGEERLDSLGLAISQEAFQDFLNRK